jgi:hypothetical protein
MCPLYEIHENPPPWRLNSVLRLQSFGTKPAPTVKSWVCLNVILAESLTYLGCGKSWQKCSVALNIFCWQSKVGKSSCTCMLLSSVLELTVIKDQFNTSSVYVTFWYISLASHITQLSPTRHCTEWKNSHHGV